MYSKEDVIAKIGEYNWDRFDTFMIGSQVEQDENGLDIYYSGDVAQFCEIYKIKQ